MSKPAAPDEQGTSTRPYLIRALHTWCADNGFTPYIAVHVSPQVQVPVEYVKNNEIVLNVGFEATSSLKLGNEMIEFRARFGGLPRDIVVPVDHVVAIYARENGQGMAFAAPSAGSGKVPADPASSADASRGGLRLATSGEAAQTDTGDTEAADTEAGDLAAAPGGSSDTAPHAVLPDAEPPEPPPAKPAGPASGRPSLKRIK